MSRQMSLADVQQGIPLSTVGLTAGPLDVEAPRLVLFLTRSSTSRNCLQYSQFGPAQYIEPKSCRPLWRSGAGWPLGLVAIARSSLERRHRHRVEICT